MGEVLCGVNSVREALQAAARRVERLWIAERREGKRIAELLALAAARRVQIEIVLEPRLTQAARTPDHQGVVAFLESSPLRSLEDLVAQAQAQQPVAPLVVLDGLKDPRNLGAIIRSAAAFGIKGIILRRWRAVGLTATVTKVAAGGMEYVAVAEVPNIPQSIQRLKRAGFWIVGADERGEESCDTFTFPSPLALILGEEGRGLSSLVRRHCDVQVRVPLRGALRSLNVAVAAAILIYEVMRQQGPHTYSPAVPGLPIFL